MNPVKDFIRELDRLDSSRSSRDKFCDLVELAYCAFAKKTALTTERADALEARYMSIVGRYQDKDTIRAYPHLLGIAWDAVAAGGCDFLGEVAGELAVLTDRNGQFFTPYSVARMMAEITLTGVEDVIERDGYITIEEPASGAGVMLLAAADVLVKRGYDLLHLLVQATDISPLCYQMCFLQLTWRGIPAQVLHGDTLRLEVWEQAWTLATFPFFDRHGRLFKESLHEPTAKPTTEPVIQWIENVPALVDEPALEPTFFQLRLL